MVFLIDHASGQAKLRVQIFKKEEGFTMWVVESSEEIYTINFNSILGVDVYKVKDDVFQSIFLFRDDDEDFNVEIGKFISYDDAVTFLNWVKKSLT